MEKKHDQFVEVPKGTKPEDWLTFIAPKKMGQPESGSNGDNALLVFESRLEPDEEKGNKGWKVTAQYMFRWAMVIGGEPPQKLCKWVPSEAIILLIPRQY